MEEPAPNDELGKWQDRVRRAEHELDVAETSNRELRRALRSAVADHDNDQDAIAALRAVPAPLLFPVQRTAPLIRQWGCPEMFPDCPAAVVRRRAVPVPEMCNGGGLRTGRRRGRPSGTGPSLSRARTRAETSSC